jgi:hypothetical protein
MASKNAFFNIRPTRRSNPEARTTLDALHTYHISQIKDKTNHVNELKDEITTIREKKAGCQNPIELSAIEEQESEFQGRIYIPTHSIEIARANAFGVVSDSFCGNFNDLSRSLC